MADDPYVDVRRAVPEWDTLTEGMTPEERDEAAALFRDSLGYALARLGAAWGDLMRAVVVAWRDEVDRVGRQVHD
jgi:hypothetical protein